MSGRKAKIEALVEFTIDLDDPVTINGSHKIVKLGGISMKFFGEELKNILKEKHRKNNVEIFNILAVRFGVQYSTLSTIAIMLLCFLVEWKFKLLKIPKTPKEIPYKEKIDMQVKQAWDEYRKEKKGER